MNTITTPDIASNMPTHMPTPAEAANLTGKTILVTGGASGLGAALAHVLCASGANVVIADLNLDKAQTVAALLASSPGTAQAIGVNVGDPAAAEHAIDDTISRFGRLDILINNAGTDKTCPIEELEFDDWDRVMRTNLYGPYLLSKRAAVHMKETGSGQIVNIASTAARRAWPNASAYHASKYGLLGLSHALHAELRPFGIKVTAVLCGGMRTPFLLDRFPEIDVETLQDPVNVAKVVRSVLTLPEQTVIPEVMVLPMGETSWP